MATRDEEIAEVKQMTWARVAWLFVILVAIGILIPIVFSLLVVVVKVAFVGGSLAAAESDFARNVARHAPRDLARGVFVAVLVVAMIAVIKLRPDLFAREPSKVRQTRAVRPAVVIAAGVLIAAGALSTAFLFADAFAMALVPPLSALMNAYWALVDAMARAAEPGAMSVLAFVDALLGGKRALDVHWLHGAFLTFAMLASAVLAWEVAPPKNEGGRGMGTLRWAVMVPALLVLLIFQTTEPAINAAVTFFTVELLPISLGLFRLTVPALAQSARDVFRFAIPFASVPVLTLLLFLANAALK